MLYQEYVKFKLLLVVALVASVCSHTYIPSKAFCRRSHGQSCARSVHKFSICECIAMRQRDNDTIDAMGGDAVYGVAHSRKHVIDLEKACTLRFA